MYRSRKRNLGDIPQNLRPERVERAQQIPFTAEQPLEERYIAPPTPIPNQKNRSRNIALRGRFSPQTINVTDVAKTPLSSNPNRLYFIVQNNGTNDVFINFGNKAGLGNLKIVPDGNYEPFVCPIDSISLVCGSGLSSICAVIEAVEVSE